MSCLVRQPLARRAFDGNGGTLHVINAKLGAGVLPEIELGQVTVKMLGVDVLVNADNAALEDRKEAFKRVGMHVAALPFKLGVVNRAMAGRASEFENWRAIRHQPTAAIKLAIEQPADAAMVDDHRADRAATLDKAQHFNVALASTGAFPRLNRTAQFHIVGFDRLAFAANRPSSYPGSSFRGCDGPGAKRFSCRN